MELRPPRSVRDPEIADKLEAVILNSATLTGILVVDLRRVGRGWRFRLVPNTHRTPSGRLKSPALYHRLSTIHPWEGYKQRHINAVCWHGHRDFMALLFDLLPDVTLRTKLATYKGKEGFEQDYPDTYYTNAGSQMYPQYYGNLCHCDDKAQGRTR
jgi:hypothetical protein